MHWVCFGERHSRLRTKVLKLSLSGVFSQCAWSPVSWGRIVRNLGRIFLLDPLSASKDTFHLEVGNYWRVLSKIKIRADGKTHQS